MTTVGSRAFAPSNTLETHCDVELVADVYRNELEQLESQARVHEFVPVLAVRRTRDRLRGIRRRQ